MKSRPYAQQETGEQQHTADYCRTETPKVVKPGEPIYTPADQAQSNTDDQDARVVQKAFV